MELKIVISFDGATKEIINNLITVMGARTITTLVPLEEKDAPGEAEEKSFVEELDEIDRKRTEESKSKKTKPKKKEAEIAPVQEETATGPTIEDVRQTLAGKKKQGYTAEIKKVLASFGVKMVSDIKPVDYEAVIQAVNAL